MLFLFWCFGPKRAQVRGTSSDPGEVREITKQLIPPLSPPVGAQARKPFDEALRDGLTEVLAARIFCSCANRPARSTTLRSLARPSYFLWSSLPDECTPLQLGELKSQE